MNYDWINSPLYKLLLTGRNLKFPKGQVVNAFDDNAMINLIKSGYAKRYLITKDGTKAIQVIYGPFDFFPLTPVYKNIFKMDIYTGPEQYYYEAMSDLEIFSITQTELAEAVEKNPLIYKDLYYAAGLRLNSYIYRLESMSTKAANRKVAHQLVFLSEVFGEKTDEGTKILVPLTHQTIADALNLARETVTHCLVRLEEKGLIKADKQIIVLNREGLRRLSH